MEARAAFERLGAEVDSDAMTLRRAYLHPVCARNLRLAAARA